MEELVKIFDSAVRVKVMRYFLFHEHQLSDIAMVSDHSRVDVTLVRSELLKLHKIGFLTKRPFVKETKTIVRGKEKVSRKKVVGYRVNAKFDLVEPLRNLLIEYQLVRSKEMTQRFKATGKLKLLALSGLFVKDDERMIDLLLVIDQVKKKTLEKTIRVLESEIGVELRYSIFTTEEFIYRLEMYDKLLRDVLDHTHEMVVDRIGKRFPG